MGHKTTSDVGVILIEDKGGEQVLHNALQFTFDCVQSRRQWEQFCCCCVRGIGVLLASPPPLLPDKSRPLENATLTTPQSYLSRRELWGIVMSAFNCGGVALERVAANIWEEKIKQFLSVEFILTNIRDPQYHSEISPTTSNGGKAKERPSCLWLCIVQRLSTTTSCDKHPLSRHGWATYVHRR